MNYFPPEAMKRYEPVAPRGSGSYGVVWEARHRNVADLRVAVKVLHARWATDPDVRERFGREAQAAARVGGDRVAKLLDYSDDSATPYIVYEWIDGMTVENARVALRTMSASMVAAILADTLEGLRAAHEAGVVHRDLKPANLMLAKSGSVYRTKVLDFGIAKLVSESADGTATGAGALCTPAYAAPELLLGRPEKVSDLYAVGHIAIELLSGAAPYAGQGAMAAAALHGSEEPVPIPEVHRATPLGTWIAGLVAKKPAERTPDVASALSALQAIAGNLPAPDWSALSRLEASAGTPVAAAELDLEEETAAYDDGPIVVSPPVADPTFASGGGWRRHWAAAGLAGVLIIGGAVLTSQRGEPSDPAQSVLSDQVDPAEESEPRVELPAPTSETELDTRNADAARRAAVILPELAATLFVSLPLGLESIGSAVHAPRFATPARNGGGRAHVAEPLAVETSEPGELVEAPREAALLEPEPIDPERLDPGPPDPEPVQEAQPADAAAAELTPDPEGTETSETERELPATASSETEAAEEVPRFDRIGVLRD